MASCSTSANKENNDLVDQFCAVTGASKEIALHFLEACDFSLESAVEMFLDSGSVPLTSVKSSSKPSTSNYARPGIHSYLGNDDSNDNDIISYDSNSNNNADIISGDEIRAPIPQKKETLVEDGYNFNRRAHRRRPASTVFDAFRDFQEEARHHRSQQSTSTGSNSTSPTNKRHTLEELFRPPIDLMFKGSFIAAKEFGVKSNKWLIVNVQNVREFSCQVLNRDVWSSPDVKSIIKKNFVLWQVYSDSAEGLRYMQFYKVSDWPYISFLDPRTGEKLFECNKIDSKSFCHFAEEFLEMHNLPCQETPPRKKLKSDSILDASEDSQLNAALQASIKDNTTTTTTTSSTSNTTKHSKRYFAIFGSDDSDDDDDEGNDNDDIETFSDSNDGINSANVASPKKLPQQKTATAAATVASTQSCSMPHTNMNGHSKLSTLSSPPSSSYSPSSSPKSLTSSSIPATSCGGLNPTKDTQWPCCTYEPHADLATTPEQLSFQQFLGQPTDPISTLVLRFPDGKREQLKWPCTSKLQALLAYLSEHGFKVEDLELVTNYPRRVIDLSNPLVCTLEGAKLFPHETIFVQLL